MTNTPRLSLPLIQAAQAQKHITANEAFLLLDAATQLVLEADDLGDPPPAATEGRMWAVPSGATGVWSGHTGEIAVGSNGGWLYLTPDRGWTGWIKSRSATATFDGTGWRAGICGLTPNGARFGYVTTEFDVSIPAGPSFETSFFFPAFATVHAVTGRVLSDVTGGLSDWQLGVADDPVRYGDYLGLSTGSTVMGVSGAPTTYYSETPLLLSGRGGDFSGGAVRLAVHYFVATPPEV